MPITSVSPSTVVSAGAWTGATNVYTSNNVYATNTGATQNTEYPVDVGGFDFSAIPDTATIISVTATVEAKCSNASRAQVKAEIYDGSTLLVGGTFRNLTNQDANYSDTVPLTLAQLKSPNLKFRVVNKRIVSQAATTSVDWIEFDVEWKGYDLSTDQSDSVGIEDYGSAQGVAPAPKIATLTDDFSGTLAQWPGTYGTVALQSGQVKITASAGYPALWTDPNVYDMVDSAAFAKMTMPTDLGGNSREMVFEIRKFDNTDKFYFYCNGPNLTAAKRITGVISNHKTVTYDPVAHAWLKIEHTSPGTLVWSTSPDGINWTVFYSDPALGFTPSRVEVVFTAGWYGTETAWDIYVDNFNVPGTPSGQALTVDAGDAVGVTDAVQTSSFQPPGGYNSLAGYDSATDYGAPVGGALAHSASDTVGVTDSASSLITKALLPDLAGVTDTGTTAVGRNPVADPVGIIDTASVLVGEAAVDPVALTDSVATALFRALAASLSDTVAVTDTETSASTLDRADPVTITDTFSGAGKGAYEASDTVAVSDTSTTAATAVRGFQDPLGVTDTASLATALVSGVGDAVGVTDSVAAAKGGGVAASDSAGLTDTASLVTAATRTYTDTAGVTDFSTEAAAKDISETAGVTDSIAVAKASTRDFQDPVAVTDTAATLATYDRAAQDPVNLTDSIATTKSSPGDFADLAGLTDSVLTAATYLRNYADAENVTDAATAFKGQVASAVDTVGITDRIDLAVSRSYADAVGITDSAVASKASPGNFTDTTGITDSVALAVVYVRTYTDPAGTTDTISTFKGQVWSFTDPAGLTDAIIEAVAKGFSDAAGITDSGTEAHAKNQPTEPVGITDAISVIRGIIAAGGRPDVWMGAAYAPKPGKWWNGTVWIEKPWKRWDGAKWVMLGGAFDPRSVVGLAVWWDAADLATFRNVWPDKSGNGRDGAVVGTPWPVLQPNALNGLQVVRITAGQGRIRQFSTGVTKDYTLIIVNRKWRTTSTGGRCLGTGYSPGPNTWYGYHVNPAPTGNMHSFADGTFSPSTGVAADLNWYMYSVDAESVPSYRPRAFINGTFAAQSAGGGATGLGGHVFLSGYSATGTQETGDFDVAELLLYNRKLPDAERQTVEGYLREKWSLA